MKKYFLTLLISAVYFVLIGQNTESFKPYLKIKANTAISGKGALVWMLPDFDFFHSSATPVFQISGDYVFDKHWSFGLAGSYQYFNFILKENPVEVNFDFNLYSGGLRFAYLPVNKKSDILFIGARLSVNYWNAKIGQSVNLDSLNIQAWEWNFIQRTFFNNLDLQVENNQVKYNLDFQWFNFPFQLNMGYEHYFGFLGFNAEMCLGSPYLLSLGLNLKL